MIKRCTQVEADMCLMTADDRQALIWDIQQMPRAIEDPILAYTAAGEINQIQWSSTQPDWIAICYNNCLEILRVQVTAVLTDSQSFGAVCARLVCMTVNVLLCHVERMLPVGARHGQYRHVSQYCQQWQEQFWFVELCVTRETWVQSTAEPV